MAPCKQTFYMQTNQNYLYLYLFYDYMSAGPEAMLIPLLVILALELVVPELFKKLRIPFVTTLILLGAILGPNGINYIHPSQAIELLGFLGMTFLMFMAGLETDITKLKSLKSKLVVMSFLNGIIPFIVGVGIGRLFNYGWLTSLLIGTIFISSSVAVVVPSLKSAGLFNKSVGQLILSAVLVLDILSLVVLSFIFQKLSPITTLTLPLYFAVIILSIAGLFYILPGLTKHIFNKYFTGKSAHENQIRYTIVVLIGALTYFHLLGVHPILAAFIVGLALVVKSDEIYSKFHALGYGFFVPIFFFIVGMQMDLSVFKQLGAGNMMMIAIVFGLILSKFLSGLLAGRLVKLSWKESSFFGSASIIQITTTLAVTYVGASLGILDNILVTSIIMMSVVTTIVGPIALKVIEGIKIKE